MSNVPKLRFEGFDGEWLEKQLGEVITNKSKKYNPSQDSGVYKCIELEHLESDTGRLLGHTTIEGAGSSKNRFYTNNVLFGKLRPYLNKYHKPNFDGICSSEIWVLSGLEATNDFAYRIVQSPNFLRLANQSSGSKMPRADWKVVENGMVSIPPSDREQQKIAAFLTAVDTKIEQLTKKEALFKQYKKGVMQKIFSQEIRFKAGDGSEFPEWENRKFGEIFERITTKNKENNQNVLTISAQQGLVNQEDYFNKSVAAQDVTGYYLLHKDDFAYNKSYSKGYPLGAIKRLNKYEKGVVSTLYICFRAKNCETAFAEQFFENGGLNREIHKIAQEGVRNHGLLNMSVVEFFKDIELVLPCRAEQYKIAELLANIDLKIEQASKQLTFAKIFKQGLLQQMFV